MFDPLEEEQVRRYVLLSEDAIALQGIQATSLFDLTLRVCLDIHRSRVIDSPYDEMSVVFYGTVIALPMESSLTHCCRKQRTMNKDLSMSTYFRSWM